MPIETEPITTLPEAPATLRRHQSREGRDDRGIPSGPIYEGTIVCRPSQRDCATGPLNWKAALRDQVGDDLPAFSRP